MTLEDAWYKIEDQFFGTPMYMPPERILGEGEDYRADIYSLGMVLYHCIKGQTYFNDNEIMRLVNRQASNLRIKTSTKLTNFTDEVAQLIDDLIAPDRSMRYDGYELIRQDICHILDDLQQNESSHPLILKRRQEFK